MIVIPAIDIMQGRVVRLQQGDFGKEKFYADNPLQMAEVWQRKGAKFMHIVDLDGARVGEVKNRGAITNILENINVPCQVGGGIRKVEEIEYYLEKGAAHVMLGTVAFENMAYLKELIKKFDEKIVISIDFAGNIVVKKGWQERTDASPLEMANKMASLGVKTLVVTDIAMDGTLKGPNIEKLKELVNTLEVSIIASGGISSLEDIKKLKEIKSGNLKGVIVGRALYEGKIDLEEAIRIAEPMRN